MAHNWTGGIRTSKLLKVFIYMFCKTHDLQCLCLLNVSVTNNSNNNDVGAQRDSSVVLNCTTWAGGGWGSGWDENSLVTSSSNSGGQTLPHTLGQKHTVT